MSGKHLFNADSPERDAVEAPDAETTAAKSVGSVFSDHKGKLAIGVAATLGLMVFYKWREKRLAKDDPEEYARLQRLKAGVRNGGANAGASIRQHSDRQATRKPAPAPHADDAEETS